MVEVENILNEAERLMSLKKQHIKDINERYNDHNRHPVKVPMRTLGNRRVRRTWHSWMKNEVYTFNTNGPKDSTS